MNYEYGSPFDSPGGRQLAAWTLELASDRYYGYMFSADQHLWALLYACCAAAVPPPEQLTKSKKDVEINSDRVLTTLKELQRQYGSVISGRFTQLYLDGIRVYESRLSGVPSERFRKQLETWRDSARDSAAKTITSCEQNLDYLAELLPLNETEKKLMLFQLYRNAPGFGQLYDMLLHTEEGLRLVLSKMLQISEAALEDALSEGSVLVRSGLVDIEERPLHLHEVSPYLRATLTRGGDEESLMRSFIKPLEPSATTASLARLDERDQKILLRILELPVPEEHGSNVLVYGPRSVDKRDMLARLLAEHGIDSWELVTKKVQPSALPTWAFIAQRYLEREDPSSVLVIPDADKILTGRRSSLMQLFGFMGDEEPEILEEEHASDEGLTASRVRCLWLSSMASSLSEDNLGKFLFHCEAMPGSRKDRRERVGTAISEFGLSKELEDHLSRYSLLGERQVRQAATLARFLHADGAKIKDEHLSHEHVIKRAVHQSQKALGREHTESLRDSVTKYSLDLLNVNGRFTPEQIIRALRNKPHGSLCFYGIPGTGKTQLAEYMAVELDLPLLMRSASELLSKWLGDSEKNFAAMFEEAEAEGALLFLDEADSFLRERAMARAEWSVTQVNELLQRMERFPGVFIAATNLMDSMDAAAMRRFTWKLEFLPLRAEQAWQMFKTESECKVRANSKAARALQDQLRQIPDLAPGDFATVKRQALMLNETLSPEEWLEQLGAEAKAKMQGLRRHRLGFSAETAEPIG